MNSTVRSKEKLQNTKKLTDILKRFSILTLSFIIVIMSFSFCFAENLSTFFTVGNNNSNYLRLDSNTFSSGTRITFVFNEGDYSNWSYIYARINSGGTLVSTNLVQSGTVYYFKDTNVNMSSGYITIDYENTVGNTLSIQTSRQTTVSNDPLNDYSNLFECYYGDFVTDPEVKYPYTFQNGYLFVYDLGQSGAMYSFDLTSKSEEYSNLGDYPFPDTNQSYWFSNSLPEIDETSIPDSSATIIHWLKGEKQNIFGQTQDMVASISGNSTGRYLYIYNPPAHYNWVGNSNPTASETVNYPVTINGISSGDNFYIYDSVARLADYNQGGKVQGTVGEVGYGSVASDGAITVTTSDGAIYNQVSGGSTDISGANGGSIAENINGLKQTLDDFVNQFIQLLSAPISHIQQLIQSSHQFFDVFSQLFNWLPSELSSVIVSGLIIMVVIGVIKMLL